MAEDYKLPYSGADIYRRLRDVDVKAVVKSMTSDEYEALEEINANTLYMLTDSEESSVILVQNDEPIDAEVGTLWVDLDGEGGGNYGASNSVLYTQQTLTEEQKAQARENIGAATVEDVLAALPVYNGEVEAV